MSARTIRLCVTHQKMGVEVGGVLPECKECGTVRVSDPAPAPLVTVRASAGRAPYKERRMSRAVGPDDKIPLRLRAVPPRAGEEDGMKARGKVDWVESEAGWWARVTLTPADATASDSPALLKTGYYVTPSAAQHAAEGYAKALGMEIEWEDGTRSSRPWTCPVCRGQGTVSRPPDVAGDVPGWTTGGTGQYACRACSGTGIVWDSNTTQPIRIEIPKKGRP